MIVELLINVQSSHMSSPDHGLVTDVTSTEGLTHNPTLYFFLSHNEISLVSEV